VSRADVASLDAGDKGPLDEPIAFTDAFGRLDIRELVRLWDGESGWARALRFPRHADGDAMWFVQCDRERTRLWVQRRTGDGTGEAAGPVTTLPLVKSRHETPRLYMQCPISERRCDILYLRNNRFASRQAQRLVHKSQRISGWARDAEELRRRTPPTLVPPGYMDRVLQASLEACFIGDVPALDLNLDLDLDIATDLESE
jgi:hypothetical protein